jgi:hypothetical protein
VKTSNLTTNFYDVRFEVFMAVTVENAAFRVLTRATQGRIKFK